MTDTTEKLLPCDRCGASPRMQSDHGSYRIICSTCGIQTLFQEKKRAIATWNRRAAEKPKWTKEIRQDIKTLVVIAQSELNRRCGQCRWANKECAICPFDERKQTVERIKQSFMMAFYEGESNEE